MEKDLLHTPNFKELLKDGRERNLEGSLPEDEPYMGTQSVSNLDNSQILNSRLNLLDDQVTINYDLSQPTIPVLNSRRQDKKKLSKQ
jgi:hypothetical protein